MCKTNEHLKSDTVKTVCRFGGACDRCSERIARLTERLCAENGVTAESEAISQRAYS